MKNEIFDTPSTQRKSVPVNVLNSLRNEEEMNITEAQIRKIIKNEIRKLNEDDTSDAASLSKEFTRALQNGGMDFKDNYDGTISIPTTGGKGVIVKIVGRSKGK